MRAVEATGRIDKQRRLRVEQFFNDVPPGPVRLIVLIPDEDITEQEWLKAAAQNPAFEFLSDPEEDIYTLNKSEP